MTVSLFMQDSNDDGWWVQSKVVARKEVCLQAAAEDRQW